MEKQYSELIILLKEHVRLSQQQAVLSVNTRLLFLYWEIGRFINHQKEQLGWGAAVIKQISKDLTDEFRDMKGFSVRNLNYMAQFAEHYSIQKVQPSVAQIPEQETKIKEDTNENQKVQPVVAQLQSDIHWTDFTNTAMSKVSWSCHYKNEEGTIKVDVRIEEETVWPTREQKARGKRAELIEY